MVGGGTVRIQVSSAGASPSYPLPGKALSRVGAEATGESSCSSPPEAAVTSLRMKRAEQDEGSEMCVKVTCTNIG